jgi:uncharacterized protein with von Willebrand factor type A (vWA) domain
MENNFKRFITFGTIGDEKSRKKIAEAIFYYLYNYQKESIDLNSIESENFNESIIKILSNETLREICSNDSDIAEKITNEILDFTNKTKKLIGRIENPFKKECELKLNFEQIKKSDFWTEWNELKPLLNKTYNSKQLNTSFYEKAFNESFQKTNKTEVAKTSFESIKEHLIEKWNYLLQLKQKNGALKIIDEQRKIFCEELYKRIEELKKLREALQPFTNELGRLWDMSQGRWKKASFDILKKYAELLKRDKSVQELAEMLGRMRQAEKEFEEELFASIQLKPEWKVEHASKADLIGIHESDDLSSLLPSEVALLADNNLQSLFYKKFVEKKLQTFEYQAKVLSYSEEEFLDKRQKEKEEAKGPFIICVDTSGSMHGTPETVAKMLCFAILKLAIRENRKCYLISFSTGIQTINLTDLNNSLDKILEFLSMSFHGGTDASPAMNEALRMLGTDDYKKADVIVVSDFVMPNFGETTKKQIVVAKENKTKFHSLVIGSSQNKNVIQEFDNNWLYDSSKPDCVLTLVKSISQM